MQKQGQVGTTNRTAALRRKSCARFYCAVLASSSASNCAFRAKLCALVQSPFAAAARASVINPVTFAAISLCAELRVFPCSASRFFSAAAKLAVVSCCAVEDSCTVSCGATNGDCVLLGSVDTGGRVTTRGRRGALSGTIGKGPSGGLNTSRSSAGSSCAASCAICSLLPFAGGRVGRTIDAFGHISEGRRRSAHPLANTATHNKPATALLHERCKDKSRNRIRSDRTGWSVMG